MGGFAIYVLPEGVAPLQGKIYSTNGAFGKASIIAAPGTGDAPMMVCFPYTYTQGEYTYAWAWPRELCTIADGIGGGAYPSFAGWVNDHKKNTDWYKYPNVNTVSELKWKNTDEPSQEQGGGEEQQPVDNRRIPQIGGVPFIGWTSTGSAITGNNTFFVPNGSNVWFKLTVNGSVYTGSGTWSATINQGNSQSSVVIWNKEDGPEIYMGVNGDSYGQATVTLTFSGDENYKSASVTYILKNMKKVHFTRSYGGNKWGMAINDDNKLILTGDNESDNNQNWYLVDPGVGDGRFWLYNVGKQLFVSFDNKSYATELSADVPTGTKSSRLTMDEYGYISDAYHGPTYVFGVKVEGGVPYVVLLKNNSDNSENIITCK